MSVLRRDYNGLVSLLLHSFPPDNALACNDAAWRLRRRPCAALLLTLRWRLLNSERRYAAALRHVDRFGAFVRELL
jgi:hypothetical protein